MKRLSLHHRVEVLPALHGRALPPVYKPSDAGAETGGRLTFDQRATRPGRFPLEQSLARSPEPPRLGRFLDIEV